MSEVCIAAAALCLRAGHAVAGVGFRLHSLLVGGSVEARPPGARVVFGIRTKQRLATADALVDSRRLGVLVFARERRLCALLAGHIVLIRRELLLPRGFLFADFLVHDYSLPLCLIGLCLALLNYQIHFAVQKIHVSLRMDPIHPDSNPKAAMPEKLEKPVSDKRVA